MAIDQNPLIYLNNAATSWPKPPGVLEAIEQSILLPAFGSGRTTGTQGEDYATQARERLSAFLGSESPENIAFTHSATDSLNILITGFLHREKGECHVLTTALDHNSVLRPLNEYAQQHRIRLDTIPFSGCHVLPVSVEAAIRPDTKLMVMTHGSNVLGSVQDITTIGDILHDHGIYFIVDGAQTAGHIPLSLRDLPVDAYVFTGHKGLLGVAGTGGFYIRDPGTVEPVRFGGTGTDSFSLLHPRGMPERFEIGTQNYPGLAALAAGVEFIRQNGMLSIAEKMEKQTAFLVSELKNEENITVYNEHPDLPIIAFNIRGLQNDDVGFMLARGYNIVTRTGLHCAPLVHKAIDRGAGCVRISHSWHTTDKECRIAADAIREIARNADPSVGKA